MDLIEKILVNTSLWEVVALIIVIYLLFKPDIINRITKFKIGDFEMELSELKKDVIEGKEKVSKLEEEIENEKRRFQELINKFDANVPIDNLKSIRQNLKSQSRSISKLDIYKQFLSKESTPEELYATAVIIREKRPIELFSDIINLLDNLSKDPNLGGFRLNTVWTITSSIHRILISCVRDGVEPIPSSEEFLNAEIVLKKLELNPRVVNDMPDKPMKGIRGPIKHSLRWIKKARVKFRF